MTQGKADWGRMAAAIKRRRGKLRLNQEELAERAQVGVETVRQLERAKQSSFRVVTLAAVSEALEWPAQALEEIALGGTIPEVNGDDLRPRVAALEATTAQHTEILEEIRADVRSLLEREPEAP